MSTMQKLQPLIAPTINPIQLNVNSTTLVGRLHQTNIAPSEHMFIEAVRKLKFSIPSNLFFLCGGLCFLISAYRDLLELDQNSRQIRSSSFMISWNLIYFGSSNRNLALEASLNVYIIVVGSVFYIFNSFVDFVQCIHFVKRSPDQINLLHRSIRSSTLAASFFGVAAFIDFVGCFSHGESYDANRIAILTSTLYLFSAISSISGLAWDFSNAALILGFMGEFLFVLGSILDCLTSYVSDPDIIHLSKEDVHRLAFISSVLWVVDAILYLAADAYILRRTYRNRDFNIITNGFLLNESDGSLEEHSRNEEGHELTQSAIIMV